MSYRAFQDSPHRFFYNFRITVVVSSSSVALIFCLDLSFCLNIISPLTQGVKNFVQYDRLTDTKITQR